MNEKWTRWEPINSLSKKYHVKYLFDSIDNGFQVLLIAENNEEKQLLISFPNSVNAFRQTDETFTLFTIDYLNKIYGDTFYSEWTFFKVENSNYLESIAEQSLGIAEPPYYNFIHYCIITSDLILDIASTYEPTVTLIDEN